MNTHDYDRIIELYLDGALSPVEEHEFRALVALEPDLRRLLDAELAVRRAIDHDAETIAESSDRPYARFLAALAIPGAAASVNDPQKSPAGLRQSPPRGWFAPGVAKYAGALLLAAGMAVATYLAVSDDNSEPSAPATQSRSARLDTSAARSAARSSNEALHASQGAMSPATVAKAKASSRSMNIGSSPRAADASSQRAAATAPRSQNAHDRDEQFALDNEIGHEDDLPLIENDSVSARINLKLER